HPRTAGGGRYLRRVRARRVSADNRAGGGSRRDAARDRPRADRRFRAPGPGRDLRAAPARTRDRRGQARRHSGGDPHASGDLPPRDGACDRALPDAGHPRQYPRGGNTERGLRRDPGGARAGGRQMILRKSQAEIEGMARAGEIVADTLAMIGEELRPGISMLELDRLAEEYIRDRDGVPTSKGYRGYPATLCISPNAMIVPGIPTEYRAEEGDVISVDLGVTLDGLIADSAYTFGVGEIAAEAQRLLGVCQEALAAGIERSQAGNHVSDIGHAVQTVVEGAGFSAVRTPVGRGAGRP